MADRTNRREDILQVAAELFLTQGYQPTSVRQIAEQVGVTEAALYYHFPGGKRALFAEVVAANMPDFIEYVHACQTASSLRDFVAQLAHRMAEGARAAAVSNLRWLITEFPTLNDEERDLVHDKNRLFRQVLCEEIQRYVADPAEAERIMWMFMFVMFGYANLMINLGVQEVAAFDLDAFVDDLANRLACGCPAGPGRG